HVLRAYRVVGAESPELESIAQMEVDLPPDLYEPAERPLCVRCSRVKQDPESRRSRVDPLTDRAGRVAALECNRGLQEVRERVEHDVGHARERHVHARMRRLPLVEPAQKLIATLANGWPGHPRLDRRPPECDENSLAAILDRGSPR